MGVADPHELRRCEQLAVHRGLVNTVHITIRAGRRACGPPKQPLPAGAAVRTLGLCLSGALPTFFSCARSKPPPGLPMRAPPAGQGCNLAEPRRRGVHAGTARSAGEPPAASRVPIVGASSVCVTTHLHGWGCWASACTALALVAVLTPLVVLALAPSPHPTCIWRCVRA